MQFSNILMAMAATSSLVSAVPLEDNQLQVRDATVPAISSPDLSTDVAVTTAETVKIDLTLTATGTTAAGSAEAALSIAQAIISIAQDVYTWVTGLIKEDIAERQSYTQNIVARLYASQPMTYVICNTAYNFTGTLLGKETLKFTQTIGAEVTYDVLAFKVGVFTLEGDGGFENWAAAVPDTCTITNFKKTITCA